jgi:hypothetical protein
VTSELRVFAQSADAIDIDACSAHAARFFATRIGLADVPDAPSPTSTLRVRFVIAPAGALPGIRSAYRRACDATDRLDAERADARMGSTGLALLARRCATVWVVEREGPDDALALRLAAILASLLLGPIFDREAQALFGVKTARERLEALVTGRKSSGGPA